MRNKSPTNVPKKSKNVQKKREIANESAPSSEAKADQIAPRRAVKARKEASKAKKPAIKSGAKPQVVRPVAAIQPTDEEIRIRAYFISERRQRFALPGNASSDWVEATRQLLAETRPPPRPTP
jgi:hypothetical protein